MGQLSVGIVGFVDSLRRRLATVLVKLEISCNARASLPWQLAQSKTSTMLVVVSNATAEWSCAVAVARLAMTSTVFLLVHRVSRRAVSGAGCGGLLRLAPFFVSFKEEGFEGGPCLVACIFALPGFAVVGEKANLEEKLEGSVDHLNRSVRRIAGGIEFNSVLNLIKHCFDG